MTGAGAAAAAEPSAGCSGSNRVNVDPFAGALSSSMVPPSSSASFLLMDRPSPVPPNCLVVDPSAWTKGWTSRCLASSLIQMPVSLTLNCSQTEFSAMWCSLAEISTLPSAVNLTALLARFSKI